MGALTRPHELHHLGVRSGGAASAEEGDLVRLVDEADQLLDLAVAWAYRGPGGDEGVLHRLLGRGLGGDVPGQRDHADAAAADGVLDGGLQHAGHLPGVGDQLAVVAALGEQPVGMGLLEVAEADLRGGDVGGEREHRGHRAVGVVQAVDQVQVPRAAGARAGREPTGDLRLRAGREGRRLLVADLDPVDVTRPADRVHHGVEAVADDPVHPAHAGDARGCRRVAAPRSAWPWGRHPSRSADRSRPLLRCVCLPSSHVCAGYASQTAAAVRSSA